ncbi:26S proteasome non-ATPase regulatory subunit 9 [Nannizzia gypsea CBS 118893]|uniref:Probable 26S proteasome regulatory subunit p27 n=1 Tax=Arthroderma gypseum (strain ATCC MYA-4604 / CBS 118893) TaxID=535722 RepID=E5QZ68_ARTGP|nr:26S proteasome non-ATPase regulatory subunit 9 [Nannizzia gypsea CBS 118893]EFQ97300.1 26S proteasome non-ATPase regulatory subunit 9 [Nannizzia gypsea CBS 118893]
MGIPMDDIHTPTVPAGPVSGAGSASANLSKAGLTQLFDEKEKLEAELKILSDVLGSHGVDMNTSLLTDDGFPRADLDIAQIRTTRARIIRLRNDYKAVMLKVEEGLAAYFSSTKDKDTNISATPSTGPPAIPQDVEGASAAQADTFDMPFAKVNSVADGSPASKAGLKTGDKVCNFGNITWANHENLTKIAAVVTNNVELPILVKVTRDLDGEISPLTLRLTPSHNWGGRGLLGCHLVPL